MGSKKGGGQTIGYRYLMSLQMGLGRGPIDEIVEIRVANEAAWPQTSGTYIVGLTVATYAALLEAAFTADKQTVAQVTADGDPTKNGYYRKIGSGWTKIGVTLSSVAADASGDYYIDAPNLFGGDDKEGGIQGTLTVMMGEPTQTTPSFIASLLGGIVPAFRGACTAFFDGMVCAMSPYPKEWKFRVRRNLMGWWQDNAWYPNKCIIELTGYSDDNYPIGTIKAMNGAHILYECATNPEWGRGLDPAMIHTSSFRLAADTLYDEQFGLCVAWTRQDDLDQFVQMIVDHIGAALYIDRATGLLTLKLIRGDYDADALPVLSTESGLLSIEADEGSTQDASYNEIIVKFREAVTGNDASVRVQNLAAWQATQQFASTTSNYQALPTKELAALVGTRELQVQALGLKKFQVKLDRRGWRIAPGSVFRVNDPKRNIGNIILRAGHIEDGTDIDGTITVTAIQDVFGLPATSYVVRQPPTWTPPPRAAQAPTNYRLIEVPYRDLARNLTPADLAALTIDETFVASVVGRPVGNALNYFLYTKTSGETDYGERGAGDFAPTALINGAIGPYDTSIVFDNASGFDVDSLGSAMLIENEIVRLDAFDLTSGTATIARGCVDTIPTAHADNARLYFYDNEFVEDPRSYAAAEVISGRFLTRNGFGRLDISASPTATVTADLRQAKPYPPGKVRVTDGVTVFKVYDLTTLDIFVTDFDITWTGRDRVLEADQLVEEGAATVGPEAGVTYTIRVYDGVTLLRTDAAATSPWTYDSTMAAADGNPRHPRFELVSVRDSLESFYKHSFVVNRDVTAGYGQQYGSNYGVV